MNHFRPFLPMTHGADLRQAGENKLDCRDDRQDG